MDNVQVVRSANRKSISINIQPDQSVLVKAPLRASDKDISALLKHHEDWIGQKQQQLRLRSEIQPANTYWYLGKTYPLEVRLTQKNIIEVTDKIYIATANKVYWKKYLESWYRQQSRKVILDRVVRYAGISGLSYRSVALTSAQTRWGSCSSNKTLNFNWKLIMAPLEVIDYVVAHELAHLTEMNHSADFWETVRKMDPLYREHRTWLKRNGQLLIL